MITCLFLLHILTLLTAKMHAVLRILVIIMTQTSVGDRDEICLAKLLQAIGKILDHLAINYNSATPPSETVQNERSCPIAVVIMIFVLVG